YYLGKMLSLVASDEGPRHNDIFVEIVCIISDDLGKEDQLDEGHVGQRFVVDAAGRSGSDTDRRLEYQNQHLYYLILLRIFTIGRFAVFENFGEFPLK